jgi:hypothetical protein
MPYDATSGQWTPDSNSSTADKVSGLLSDNGAYVQQAKAAGTDLAASRGVLNSSIAAGASQKAAYDAVVPIATADASIAAQKDLSKQSFVQTTATNTQQNTAAKDLQTGQIASTEKIAGMNIDASAQAQAKQIIADASKQAAQITSNQQLATLQAATQTNINSMNIDAAAKQQLIQVASQELIAARQNTSQEAISANQNATTLATANLSASTQTAIANLQIDAAAKQQASSILAQAQQLAAQLTSQKDLAQLSADTQSKIATLNIADADKQQLLSLATQEKLAGMTQSTQLQVANMNVSSNQQDKAAAAAVSYANVYSTMVNAINSNPNIPADARAAYLDNAKTLYNNGMSLVEQTYNVQLDWGQGTPAAALPAYSPSSNTTAPAANTPASTAANYSPAQAIGNTSIAQSNDNNVSYTDPGGNQYSASGKYLGTQ